MATYRVGFAADDPVELEAFTTALRELLPVRERDTIAPTPAAVYVLVEGLSSASAATEWAEAQKTRTSAAAAVTSGTIAVSIVEV